MQMDTSTFQSMILCPEYNDVVNDSVLSRPMAMYWCDRNYKYYYISINIYL
jgi:hypothetical protein